MNRFSNEKDRTHQPRSPGTGVAYRRRCAKCNANHEQLGGRLLPRTRLWVCATCAEKAGLR